MNISSGLSLDDLRWAFTCGLGCRRTFAGRLWWLLTVGRCVDGELRMRRYVQVVAHATDISGDDNVLHPFDAEAIIAVCDGLHRRWG